MATLADIKQNLNISQLTLDVEKDKNGNPTNWLIHRETENGLIVRIPKSVAEQIKQNTLINNLQSSTSFDGVYVTHTIDFDETYTNNQAINNHINPINNKSNSPNYRLLEKKSKIQSYLLLINKLSNSEIIVASVVVGTLIASIMGFLFVNHYYYRGSLKIYTNDKEHITEFNYLVGVFSFVISSGLTYLILKIITKKNK